MKRSLCLVLTLLLMLTGLCAAAQENADSAWETVLLIGTDTRENEGAQGRADAIMVCALNSESGAIRLISLARDMWIKLPGTSSHNKINTAFRFGGADMMLEAVNETLGLEIEHYAAVNFYGFCDLIDALGGVNVELEKGEASAINKKVDEAYGSVPARRLDSGARSAALSGVQALAYARIRNLDNDFGRTGRQRKVLVAVMQKVMDMTFAEQMAFVSECFDCVETNLSFAKALTLGSVLLSHGFDDMQQLALPAQGDYHYDSADGTSKVVFDAQAVRAQARQFIYGEE